jgi:hypothetical protein
MNDRQDVAWARNERFEESWKKRIRCMAAYLGAARSVIDYGSGPEWLREYLAPEVEYFPCDYTQRCSSTIVCNFNNWEFPCVVADAAFVSGCLEYVVQPEWFIEQIATHSERVVLSYCTVDENPNRAQRRKQNWVNDLSEKRLIEICAEFKLRLVQIDRSVPTNTIFVFQRTVPLSPWAVLCYRRSPSGDLHNVGDYIQSFAAACLAGLDITDAPTIDREHLADYAGRSMRMVLNGWFSHSADALPASSSLSVEALSFHLSHRKWPDAQLGRLTDWLRRVGPVGCRDRSTLAWCQNAGVPAYFSGCITPLVGALFANAARTNRVVIVDPWLPARRRRSSISAALKAVFTRPFTVLKVARASQNHGSLRALFDSALFVGLYGRFLSDRLIRDAVWRTHLFKRSSFTTETSVRDHIRDILATYAGASMVITTRIHAALPCYGMGTPVLFVTGNDGEGRYQGLVERFALVRLDSSGRADRDDVARLAPAGLIDRPIPAFALGDDEKREMLGLLDRHQALRAR